MTDASTAPASQILEAILQRPDAMTTLVLLTDSLGRKLKPFQVLLPWATQNEGISYIRKLWGFLGTKDQRPLRSWTPTIEVEQLIKGGRKPWVVTFWLVDMPTSPQFATPGEAQAWADDQLIAAGYLLLPQGYNQEATP